MSEQKEDTKYRTIETDETNAFVMGAARIVHGELYKQVAGISPSQQFVLVGRILNFIFSHHYQISVDFAESVCNEREKVKL